MMVLVTYDVNTEDAIGKKRLRMVAKVCKDYGQRVQNSVFECLVDPAQWVNFKESLLKINTSIRTNTDCENPSRSFTGAWIETLCCALCVAVTLGRSFTGAWIETLNTSK